MKSRRRRSKEVSRITPEFRAELMVDYGRVQPAFTRTSKGFLYKGKYHIVEGFLAKGDTIVFEDLDADSISNIVGET